MARRARSLLAGLIGCPALETVAGDEPEPSDPPSGPSKNVGRLRGLYFSPGRDSVSDLT